MKYSPYFLGLLICIPWFNVNAEPNQSVAVLARACNVIFIKFGWQDGQVVPLKAVQEIIKTMQLPKDYSITPKDAIDTIANLNAIEIPEVVFHCTANEQEIPPNVVAKFYFSYILPDKTPMKTPEFVVSKVKVPEISPIPVSIAPKDAEQTNIPQ